MDLECLHEFGHHSLSFCSLLVTLSFFFLILSFKGVWLIAYITWCKFKQMLIIFRLVFETQLLI